MEMLQLDQKNGNDVNKTERIEYDEGWNSICISTVLLVDIF